MTKLTAADDHPAELPERRRFIAAAACLASGAILGLRGRVARAEPELSHVDEADPTAAALGYKEDAARVDKAQFPEHLAMQHCGTCKFMLDRNEAYGRCQIFVGKAVSSKGWCSAYAAQA
ncbi:MAG: high-potential iron-sulfur protein [Tahibacter sp.]